MKTLFYFIRHGQSQGNLSSVFTGSMDVPLTELGRRQAALAGETLRNLSVKPDVLLASPLQRAMETAALAGTYAGLSPSPCPAFKEIDGGVWEGMPFSSIAADYPEEYAVWKNNLGLSKPPMGESVLSLSERVLSAVKELCRLYPGKTLAVGTHATPVRVLEAAAEGLPPEDLQEIPWAVNGSVSAFLCDEHSLFPLFYSYAPFPAELSTALPANI